MDIIDALGACDGKMHASVARRAKRLCNILGGVTSPCLRTFWVISWSVVGLSY